MKARKFDNVFEIIKKNFKSAFSNPIVTILLIVLIILPSLFALFNIQACWDPYEDTGDVAFAIANLDKCATFEGANIMMDLTGRSSQKKSFVTVFTMEIIMQE